MNPNYFKSIDVFQKIAKKYNWKIFANNTKPYNLNIWVIRNTNKNSDTFDDLMIVFHKDVLTNKWIFEDYVITADSGKIELLSPKHRLGVAIIMQGQYHNAWKLGLHKGYPALVQCDKITVIRDFNKDSILNIVTPEYLKIWKGKIVETNLGEGLLKKEYYNEDNKKIYITEDTNKNGLNCHRASAWKILEKIGLYSQGCIVHQNPYRYANSFIKLCKNAAILWGDKFTFTVCHEEEFL